MSNVRQFIFPGAIIGSLVLASFGYTVMASVPSLKTYQSTPANHQPEQETEISAANQIAADQNPASSGNGEGEIECTVNPAFPQKIRRWCTQIMRHSKVNNLDPNLVASLIWQESGGNPTAYSKSGAVGLMQVMPQDGIASTFQCVNGPCFVNRPTIAELQKPNFNIKYGTGMLAGLVNKYGSMREALKYYGPMDVGYYYADKVLGIFDQYGG